ncbi:phosphoenolpyruvate carboxykinase (ATP) [Leptolyngbya sp. 7M]|uniref:phosphoenolpyruvate carboxykinase (ATP) n=1 Tax=Leptolyngbya sp. 7M TaxID=2812896 RepID=UPI001B8C9396|nr:phosphoenolpyruvate carboxykinase (ATP) [Leptolyngbya sp. 7M]QYO68147.1 phosphoenolpyruvate carboxykinase (ATP) [Leptolyngbya sp. 7M]
MTALNPRVNHSQSRAASVSSRLKDELAGSDSVSNPTNLGIDPSVSGSLLALGMKNLGQVYRNLAVPALVEHALRRGEGQLSNSGALCVETGKYTGRSPKDRFIVNDPTVSAEVDWNQHNVPISEATFERLYQRALTYVAGRDLYVFDGYAGADPNYRFGVRVINEFAFQNLFAHQLFLRPSAPELQQYRPDFTVIALPGLQGNPELDGLHSEAFIILHLSKRIVLIGGSRYAGEIKKSVFSLLNYHMTKRGEAPYATNWLAGKALAQFKANDLRLPEQKQSFDAVLEILALISYYNELVICFDELDDLVFNDHGLHISLIVASFVKELFENLHRGVILSVMVPGTWNDRIKKEFSGVGGIISKITAQGQPYELKYLDSDSTVELVAFFLREFYDSRNLIPPHPVYPFEEGQLRAIGREKPTVREVLKWCREHCKPPQIDDGEVSPPPEVDPVELAFTNELSVDIRNSLDDNHLLADALCFGFETILGEVVEGVKLEEVTTGVGKRGKKDEYLNFKILGQENGRQVSIGVAVLQHDGGKALGAGFKRLLDQKNNFDLTRGCLVRSKDKPLSAHLRNTYLQPLVQSGGEFVELKENEIKPLMAMLSVYRKRESDYKVTEAEIFNFIRQQGAKYWLGIHNPLLKEILSDPSYQIPADLQDEPEVQADLVNNFEEEDTDALKELAHA